MNSSQSSLWRLLIAQTQVVFNDNAAKLVLIGAAPLILSKTEADWVTDLLAVLLVLPFALFSPLCGWVADRFPKKTVLRRALYLQGFLILILTGALYFHQLKPAIAVFFFLACQACLFSPAKQGALKEIVGSAGLGRAVGLMESLTICAILLGSLGGGWLFDRLNTHFRNPWTGATIAFACLSAGCGLSILVFRGTETGGSKTQDPFNPSLFWSHFRDLFNLWSNRSLFLCAIGVAYFYALGGALYLVLIQVGRDLYPGTSHAALTSGWFLALLGMGVIAGSTIVIYFSKHRQELGLVPVGGIGLTIGLVYLAFAPAQTSAFEVGLLGLGVCSGLFIVPLNTFLQDRSPEDRRGRVLAAANLLINLGGIAAVGYQALLANILHFSSRSQMLALVPSTLLVALCIIFLLPESMLRFLHGFWGRVIYRVRVLGAENIPSGGALFVCNHVSYVDAIVLQLACPRPIRFMSFDEFFSVPLLGWILRISGAIPVSPLRAKDAIQKAAAKLQQGELVCIFPEGELTHTGKIMGFRKGFELIARRAGAPVVPVHLDSLWGSIFSFTGGRYFFKLPKRVPHAATVSFGKPVPPDAATASLLKQRIFDLGEAAFHFRPEVTQSLGLAIIHALRQRPWKTCLIDCSTPRKSYSRASVLGTALALSRSIAQTPGKRVGIALQPGAGAVWASLACIFSGKIPVHLDPSLEQNATVALLQSAGIETLITDEGNRGRFKSYLRSVLDIADLISSCGKTRILLDAATAQLLPPRRVLNLPGIENKPCGDEAALLFTNNNSRAPLAVPLTHANILGNINQVDSVNILRKNDVLLGCLPLFHGVGLTMTLWLPLLKGLRLVTVPSSLDISVLGNAVHSEKVTLLPATTDTLADCANQLDPAQLSSVRTAIVESGKPARDLMESNWQKLSIPVLEGYGLPEATTVVAFNLPDPHPDADSHQQGGRAGSAGPLLPGIAVRLFEPGSGRELALTETGMLAIKGINVFHGYLNDSGKTAEILHDGWLLTGDLARFDDDGFLYIEGPIPRASIPPRLIHNTETPAN
ncbi:MAG: MFS transporter [Methylacidiphilales bacterium]|nr:MFS transporter [Candidatus Methylacidiphilales bacterium]